MKKYFSVVLFLIVIVTVICLSGCLYDLVIPESDLDSAVTEDDSSPPTQEDGVVPGKGTLKIYLTDTLEKNDVPDTYDAIFISISHIEAHFVENDVEPLGTEDAGESKKGNWQVIADWSKEGGFEVDLIALKGKSILLASLEGLPSRKYTQLRVFLVDDQATIVVNEGDYPLNIPSVGQTGIKLIHQFVIIPGLITELTLDFDAKKSIIETGNGEYKLKPVIRIISSYSEDLGELYLGSIEGVVNKLDVKGIIAEVIEDDSVKIEGLLLPFEKTTTPDSDGYYTIIDIPFGVYKVTASADEYIESFQNIIIDSGEVITVDFGLEPKEPE